MIVAGIDYSTTSPAITIYDTSKAEFGYWNVDMFARSKKVTISSMDPHVHVTTYSPKDRPKLDIAHYHDNAQWAGAILKRYGVEQACIEGYGHASKSLHKTCENTGLLKMIMWKLGIPWVAVTPNQVKKHFTGVGNAKKDLMCSTFYDTTKVQLSMVLGCKSFDTDPVSDLVDSYAVTKYFIDKLLTA